MLSIIIQFRDNTIVESELNDHNSHLADNSNDHEEEADTHESHIYAAVNKRNKNL